MPKPKHPKRRLHRKAPKEQRLVGGQAVIEGVMIKGREHIGIAVRQPDRKIVTDIIDAPSRTRRSKIWGLPLIRGPIILYEMLVLGMRGLIWSANQQADEAEQEQISSSTMTITIIISLLFAFLLFKFIPLGATKLLFSLPFFKANQLLFNLVDGIIRILIFVGYILLISLTPDVKRLFQYHGAEHMTVYAYEDNLPLTLKNVRKYPPQHPRCGTSFIFITLIIAILIFSVVPIDLPFLLLLALRIPLLLPIAGIAYELLKLSFRYRHNMLFKALILPGIWMQNLTTARPDDDQIEVAIRAMKTLLTVEK
ncbi:MAG: DUF1385 domain-containing protein [DPANN group archaeon]|nr:DUF1385 domain-containing protein [DPANN group archaeon]